MNIKIIVATHKPYDMPNDSMYIPVHVGREISHNWEQTQLSCFIGDDTGDNISKKNPNFCELTALYWAWKNLEADYLGLCHYRRHFRGTKRGGCSSILNRQQIEKLLENYEIILPKKRNYFIESNYDQYINAHNRQDLEKTFEIIMENYPEYLPAWEKVMKSTKGHRFNMFIMKKQLLDEYLTWLFDILFRLEKVLDISEYSENDRRVFGFVSERLLDVWLEANTAHYTELPVMNTENQHWPKKIYNFLKRKFTTKK